MQKLHLMCIPETVLVFWQCASKNISELVYILFLLIKMSHYSDITGWTVNEIVEKMTAKTSQQNK